MDENTHVEYSIYSSPIVNAMIRTSMKTTVVIVQAIMHSYLSVYVEHCPSALFVTIESVTEQTQYPALTAALGVAWSVSFSFSGPKIALCRIRGIHFHVHVRFCTMLIVFHLERT